MSRIGYILSHPVEAGRTFWRAFTGTERLADRIKDEEAKLGALRTAIWLYHLSFGRFPATLQDLCYNNHGDSGWSGVFIRWQGGDTFRDTFGYPYRYTVTDGGYELVSTGLETARKCDTEQGAAANRC
jgi:hypothetical protein